MTVEKVEIQLRGTIAKPTDYRVVVRLCRRAAGPGDYVLSILNEVIEDKGLFLAWKNGELVGMANFEKCIDGSGWLSMARTDPAWRGRGVALFLQGMIAAHARHKRIGILRLWTSSRNKPSIRACIKGGFKQVCEAARISYDLKGAQGHQMPHFQPISFQAMSSAKSLEDLQNSSYLSRMNWYLGYKRHILKADTRLMEKLLYRGELYTAGKSSFLLTKPENIRRQRVASFTLLTGPLASSLRTISAVASILGASVVEAFVPYDRYLLRITRTLGFHEDPWGKRCIVFEKAIT